jgi:hypothetical protein
VRLAAAGLAALALAACGGDEDEEAPAGVAEITCSNTTLIVTPRVTTHAHGVHVEANVSKERGVALTINRQRVRGSLVMQLRPGTHRAVCRHADGGSMESSFEVLPPERRGQP